MKYFLTVALVIIKNMWKIIKPGFWKTLYDLLSCVLYSIKLHIDKMNIENENKILLEKQKREEEMKNLENNIKNNEKEIVNEKEKLEEDKK